MTDQNSVKSASEFTSWVLLIGGIAGGAGASVAIAKGGGAGTSVVIGGGGAVVVGGSTGAVAIDVVGKIGAGIVSGAASIGNGGSKGSAKENVDFSYDKDKIGKQMGKRGWTDELIQDTLNNPTRKVKTTDNRWLPRADGPLNDPATAYYSSDGSYVVRSDATGQIVQISNKYDPN